MNPAAIFLLLIPLIFFDRWLWLVCSSVVLFFLFGWDKHSAIRNTWRIPEKTLLLGALLGGAFGGLIGMFFFRHKTSKPAIYIPVILLTLIQFILLLCL